jgi:hypothetical protein
MEEAPLASMANGARRGGDSSLSVILDRLILFHPGDEKTNVCIPIPVTRDFEALEIECTYEPKGCDDTARALRLIADCLEHCVPEEYRKGLRPPGPSLPSLVSLITLSLDYNERYLGCAHRQAEWQRHIISADFSSPGFYKQPARAGNWRAVINVHAVVSREVRYRLHVRGREKSER